MTPMVGNAWSRVDRNKSSSNMERVSTSASDALLSYRKFGKSSKDFHPADGPRGALSRVSHEFMEEDLGAHSAHKANSFNQKFLIQT